MRSASTRRTIGRGNLAGIAGEICNGFVHPVARVGLKGPNDIIKCNRNWHRLGSYTYLFRENCAGSGRLTTSVQRALGNKRVAPPEDILYGKEYDILNDAVYARKKKEAKVAAAKEAAARKAAVREERQAKRKKTKDLSFKILVNRSRKLRATNLSIKGK